MAVLRELITVLGFDVDSAEAAQANKVFDGLKKGALAVVAGATAAAAGLGVLINQTVHAGDAAAKAGKRLGITAEEVQELSFAAERSGVPVESLSAGLRSIQRRAAEAAQGNKEFAKGFQKLGVNIKDSNGKLKPTVQLFSEVAEGFKGITNEGDRTAIAMRVAGIGGAALLPLFLEGAEGVAALRARAHDLGFVINNETAAATERLADNFADLRLVFTGLGRRLASNFLPLVEDLTNKTLEWFIANRELVDKGIKSLVSVIQVAVNLLFGFVRVISENKRFILILAAVITTALIPSLLALAKTYGLVSLAALKAALIAAAPFILIIGLAVLIALVIEDVFAFVSGSESAIGNLFEAFTREAQKPGAHWMVKALAFILTTIKEAIEAVDFFFKSFFEEAEQLGGITEALKEVFSTAIDFWKDAIVSFAQFMFDTVVGALKKIPLLDVARLLSNPTGFIASRAAGALASSFGGGPSASPPSGGGGGSNTQIGVGPRSVSVSVDASSTTDPQAVADATARKVGQILEDDRRETLRTLSTQVSR